MQPPIISVIVPVYNVAPYLRRCLDSICAQSLSALQIILIDDGSTDESGTICDEYAKKDPRITVTHQENRGLSAARNKGLELARCDLVSFVDSDDWIEPDMYQVLYRNLQQTGADISTCAHDHVRLPGYPPGNPILRNRRDAMLAALRDPAVSVYAWNKLYRKALFDHVRYPEGRLFEDSYIILELLESAERMVSTTDAKYHYTRRADSITTQPYHLQMEDRIRSAQKNLLLARRKYPWLVGAARDRYLLAHYACLRKLRRTPGNLYPEQKRAHTQVLVMNFPFLLLAWVRNRDIYKKLVLRQQ